MTMPKAAVYENYSLVFSQDNIRMSRQFLIMQPVSETISVEILADNHFRFVSVDLMEDMTWLRFSFEKTSMVFMFD